MSLRRRPGSRGTPVGFCRRGRDQVGGWEGGEGKRAGEEGRAGWERRWLQGCGRGKAGGGTEGGGKGEVALALVSAGIVVGKPGEAQHQLKMDKGGKLEGKVL